MKRFSRLITILMAAVFFAGGIPAVSVAAEESETAAAAALTQTEEDGKEAAAAVPPAPALSEEASSEAASNEAASALEAAAAAAEETEPEAAAAQEVSAQTEAAEPSAASEETPSEPEVEGQDPAEEPTDPAEETTDPAEEPTTPEEESSATPEETTRADEKETASKTELSLTNNTAMFKVVSAYVEQKNGKLELVAALSGQSYDNLFVGTYEEAVKTGYDPSAWVHYFKDKNGKKAFRIPITKDTSYLPIISVSNTYLNSYLQKKNSLSRAFYARQMVLNLKKKTLVAGDYEYTLPLTIKNNDKKIAADKAALYTLGGPNNNGYLSDLRLTLSDDTYDAAFIGSGKQAAKAEKTLTVGEGRLLSLPVKWLTTFGDPDSLQSLIGKTFTVSLRAAKTGKWSEHLFIVKEKAATLTIGTKTKGQKASGDTDKIVIPGQGEESKPESNTNGTTAAVDNSTGLKDGTYTPDKFSFSGGSGKIIITCDKVEVKDGMAYATIAFRNTKSGSAEFSYAKANGQTYYCSQVGGASVVTIPVELNANTQILGLTTKMSAAHEIAYTIFVYISGADKKAADDLTKNKEMDEEAPEIAGLETEGQEELEEAEYFKVFHYSDGIRLLEIDMRKSGEKDSTETFSEVKTKEDEEDENETVVIDEETGDEVTIAASRTDAQAKLYKGNIIKYLLVPEKVEIPAGLDKETIVIRVPAKRIYSGADSIRKTMELLKQEEKICCEDEANEEKKIKGAGAFEDLSLRTLVAAKCDLVLIDGDFLKEKEAREVFQSQAEDLANLDIALMVDRSAAEKTDKAKAEWLKVYGMLFGCEEAAQQALDAVR